MDKISYLFRKYLILLFWSTITTVILLIIQYITKKNIEENKGINISDEMILYIR